MGWIVAMGRCYLCGHVFTFNPDRVPSVRIEDQRHAICRECVEAVNPARVANGLDPFVVLPGAYGLEA